MRFDFAPFARRRMAFDFSPFAQDAKKWDESKHKRGQPKNAGQFSSTERVTDPRLKQQLKNGEIDLEEALRVQALRPKEVPADLPLAESEQFKTGRPVTFDYYRRQQKTEHFGEAFGQHIEPAGRYMSVGAGPRPENLPAGVTVESGKQTFHNPLVLRFGGGYGDEANWKRRLSAAFGGKTGKKLSMAIAAAGYDGIVTLGGDLPHEGGMLPHEVVDLTMFTTHTGNRKDEP